MDAQTKQLAKPLEDLFAKAPALPASGKEIVVSFAPWISLVFGVLLVLASVGGLGVFTAFAPFAVYAGVGNATLLLIASVLGIVQGVLMVLAFSPLKAKKVRGWNLWFWAEVLSIVSSVISFNLVGAVLSALIGFYLLFQVRSHYK